MDNVITVNETALREYLKYYIEAEPTDAMVNYMKELLELGPSENDMEDFFHHFEDELDG